MPAQHGSSSKGDIQLWPLWLAIGCPLLLIALNSTPISPDLVFVLIGVPALVLIWACMGVCAAILTLRWLRQRAWLQAMIGAVLPLVVLGVSLHLFAFIHFCNDAGDIVHFLVMRPLYLKTIRATPPNGEARLLTFNLGGMIWASRGFVYDESDEVLRAPSLQTPAWKARAQNSELSCEGYYARPFPGHFAFARHWYLVSFPC
ncbi:MAG TPA: hypothetical protein VH325_06825 [Bryobacteraceae bacterium]|nr:hypothetical protein [Bryobacteraceae bacterium]